MTNRLLVATTLLLLSFATSSLAQDVPDVGAWSTSVLAQIDRLGGAFPKRVLFLTKLDEPSLSEFGAEVTGRPAAEKSCYFQKVAEAGLAWEFKLNRQVLKDRNIVNAIFAITGADAVLAPGSAPKPRIVMQSPEDPIAVTVRTPPPTDPAADISEWFLAQLEWNGVVIGVEKNLLLVATCSHFLKPNAQAIAIKNSAKKLVVSLATKSSDNLLQLVASKGPFGIFRVIFSRDKGQAFEIGTKLTIEK